MNLRYQATLQNDPDLMITIKIKAWYTPDDQDMTIYYQYMKICLQHIKILANYGNLENTIDEFKIIIISKHC
jgi:hypothetical protein